MKKLVYLFVVFFITTLTANGQYAAGGGFNLSTSGGSIDDGTDKTDKTKTSSITISPMVGYFYADNILFGSYFSIGMSKQKTPDPDPTTATTTSFGIAPFARYYALTFNKFSIYAQGQVGLSLSSSKTKTDGTTTDGPKVTNVGLSVFPGIAYDISEAIQLNASINLLSLNLNLRSEKTEIGDDTYVDKTTSFGLGANMDNIVNTGNITIGAIYRF